MSTQANQGLRSFLVHFAMVLTWNRLRLVERPFQVLRADQQSFCSWCLTSSCRCVMHCCRPWNSLGDAARQSRRYRRDKWAGWVIFVDVGLCWGPPKEWTILNCLVVSSMADHYCLASWPMLPFFDSPTPCLLVMFRLSVMDWIGMIPSIG
jgi:hypothetical protein